MSAEYEPVPTDENSTNTRDFRPAKTRLHFPPLAKALAISFAFCLISFISYKAGQWSVEHGTPSESITASKPINTLPEGAPDIEVQPDLPSNSTQMPGNGKYSVG